MWITLEYKHSSDPIKMKTFCNSADTKYSDFISFTVGGNKNIVLV